MSMIYKTWVQEYHEGNCPEKKKQKPTNQQKPPTTFHSLTDDWNFFNLGQNFLQK